MNPNPVRMFAAVALLLVLVAMLYWPTWESLAVSWTDTVNLGYTHGYLVLALSSLFLFRRRGEMSPAPVPLTGVLLTVMLLMSLLWLLNYRASIEIGYQLLMPMMLWGAVVVVFGWPTARASAFGIGYLYFAIPVWDYLMGPLQSLTVVAVGAILRLIGVPIHIQDNIVSIPEGRFEIAGGCGGLHFFIVALALAAFIGEIHLDSWRRRALLLVLAAVFAVLANWIRVSVIIMAGHLTNMQHPLITVGHYYFGWWVFAGVMVVYFVLASRLPSDCPAALPPAPVALEPARLALRAALVLAVLAVAPIWDRSIRGVAGTASMALPQPADVSPWRRSEGWAGAPAAWSPRFTGADLQWRETFSRDGSVVWMYWASYGTQYQGKELIGSDNDVAPKESRVAVITRATVTHGAVEELILRDESGADSLVWYAYHVGDRTLTSDLGTQLWFGVRSLMGPVRAGVLVLRSRCQPDCVAARRELQDLYGALQVGAG